jgi:hypothetical protein
VIKKFGDVPDDLVRYEGGVTRKTFAQTEFSGESAKVILRLEPLRCG